MWQQKAIHMWTLTYKRRIEVNVLLIAGHGNGDSGAVGNGYEEAELTREFAVLLKENLKSFCNVTLADTNRNWFEFLGSNNYDFSKI